MGVLMKAEAICKDFSGLRALNEVGFDVEEGSITAIIGPNGAGKTTLFNVISGDQMPTTGRVIFSGQTTTGLSPDRVCRLGISRTYQTVRPFPGLSVENNIRVGAIFGRVERPSVQEVERDIAELIAFVQLEGKRHEKAERLTPLERKRLELARALATQPRLLLLDELIAGLSPSEAVEMMGTIKSVNDQGVTILLIEHVMRAVMGLSNHVVVIHHGEKIAEGSPAKISKDKQVIAAYLGDALERD